MAKKTTQKIPKSLILICPYCKKGTTAKVSIENCPQKYTCPKCKMEVKAPFSQCCVICAFSKSGIKCPRTLYMKAKIKGWKVS